MKKNIPRILITSGEPAGIGLDIIAKIANEKFPAFITVIANQKALLERAKLLGISLTCEPYDINLSAQTHKPNHLTLIDLPLEAAITPGLPNIANSQPIINMLSLASQKCLSKEFDAVVTAPVNKEMINQARIQFSGHTEFFEQNTHSKDIVMLFTGKHFRLALATTHLPLKDVAKNITKSKLTSIIKTLIKEFPKYFNIANPKIYVCGLNPHAGEGGHLGLEEQKTIIPVLQKFQQQGYSVEGPFPADTIFTKKYLEKADVILAMYHDQGLPVLKYSSFEDAVNITLGLPFIRTSVDHGTAFDIAGTGLANAESMKAAIWQAIEMFENAKV